MCDSDDRDMCKDGCTNTHCEDHPLHGKLADLVEIRERIKVGCNGDEFGRQINLNLRRYAESDDWAGVMEFRKLNLEGDQVGAEEVFFLDNMDEGTLYALGEIFWRAAATVRKVKEERHKKTWSAIEELPYMAIGYVDSYAVRVDGGRDLWVNPMAEYSPTKTDRYFIPIRRLNNQYLGHPQYYIGLTPDQHRIMLAGSIPWNWKRATILPQPLIKLQGPTNET